MIQICLPPFKEGVRSTRWGYTVEVKNTLYLPFFLAYTTALLEKNNFKVDLIDAIAEDLDDKKFIKRIKKNKPELMIAEISTLTFEKDMQLMNRIKKEVGCKIALCGSHATVFAREILEKNNVDFVFLGEYELTALELAKFLNKEKNYKKIEGLAFKSNGKVIVNKPRSLLKNLNELPFPARHFLPMEKYNDGFAAYPNQQMITSRGCPFRCVYCVFPQVFYNHSVRYRSAKNIVDEMEFLLKKYRPKEIYFDDDSFTLNQKHVLDVCEEIKKRGLDVEWSCMGHANLPEDVLRKMKEVGCKGVKFGVETASPKVMKTIKKNLNLENVKKFVKRAKKVGLRTHATYMIGLPGDTKETMMQTHKMALSLNTDSFQISIATPYPGTEFYNDAKEKGWLVTNDFSKFDGNKGSVVSYPWLSKKEIDKAFRTSKDLISAVNFDSVICYLRDVYESDGLSGVISYLIRKTPRYSLRLIRKQLFKLKLRTNL